MAKFMIAIIFAAMPLGLARLNRANPAVNVPVTQSFVNTKAAAGAKVSAVPALQPADVFDSDYPVDMAGLTPQELRYRAQADYAKAVAALKREAAEAEAARIAMEKELAELQAAKEAAARAEAQAKKAAEDAARLRAALGQKQGAADAQAKDAAGAAGALSKEEAELAAAKKAYEDAMKAEEGMEAKIAAMKAKHAELCAQIKKIEAEQAGAVSSAQKAGGKIGAAEKGVVNADQAVESAEARAAREAAEAAAAKKKAEEAEARLAKAETLLKDPNALDPEVARLKKEYEMAKETYIKENNDVKAAQKRVDMAKAELAKWEQSSARTTAISLFIAVALAFHF